jgi:hypothetical protein
MNYFPFLYHTLNKKHTKKKTLESIQPSINLHYIMTNGCKQNILYILVTLFSTWKHKNFFFKLLTFL